MVFLVSDGMLTFDRFPTPTHSPMTRLTLLLVLVATAAVPLLAAPPQLVRKWETAATLKVPESVRFDGARGVLYVTNIDGEPWAKDGRGSVGKVGLDGKVLAVDWVTGLSAPKGMALRGNLLYVGDMDEVVVIDVEKAEIVERIVVTGAQGLNDVSVDAAGVLYVSDSPGKKLYRIEGGRAAVWLENLKGPNGVLAHGGELYVLDGAGMYRVAPDRSLQLIADGMPGGVDGIESVGDGGFLISCWRGALHHIAADGSRVQLLDSAKDGIHSADIGYDPKTRTVYVPTFFQNTIVAYELK